jgi:hypothetical protein
MQFLLCNVATLAVVLLFLVWKTYRGVVTRRRRLLRERVAYMLWVMAERIGESRPSGTRPTVGV